MKRELKTNRLNLVLAADKTYLYPALVVLGNLAQKGVLNDNETKVWFIAPSHSLDKSDVQLVHQVARALGFRNRFEFFEVDVDVLPETHGYLSKTSLVRLLLPKLMQGSDWFWVDADAILRCSWEEAKNAFFPLNRQSTIVAASCHLLDPIRQGLSGNPPSSYFNAGLMSWSPRGNLSDGDVLLRRYLGALKFFLAKGVTGDDQDALNTVHKNDVQLISGNFNAFGDFLMNPSTFKSVKIAHFAGATKPWHLTNKVKLACLASKGCPWSDFFTAESYLLGVASQMNPRLSNYLRRLRKKLRFSGNPDWKIITFAMFAASLPRFISTMAAFKHIRKGNQAHPLHFETTPL